MIERQIERRIRRKIGTGKAIIVMGARKTGKTTLLKKIFSDNTLWLNADEQELDCLEVSDGRLSTCEFKWSPDARAKFSKAFAEAYPGSTFRVIHRDNFDE
ncbi:MAG: hypothetical protein LBS79_05385 [Tannerella sp.]|jgi:septin family protein|nr:hypothetical protein [Tannerella sp.]